MIMTRHSLEPELTLSYQAPEFMMNVRHMERLQVFQNPFDKGSYMKPGSHWAGQVSGRCDTMTFPVDFVSFSSSVVMVA